MSHCSSDYIECCLAVVDWIIANMIGNEPARFTAAVINSLPMGFYAPVQLFRDTREHGAEVRPVAITTSEWDCTLERAINFSAPVVRNFSIRTVPERSIEFMRTPTSTRDPIHRVSLRHGSSRSH